MANAISNLFGRLLKRDGESHDPTQKQQEQNVDDLRNEHRAPANVAVRIEWFDENGVCRSEPAIIEDSSDRGLGFTVNEEFPVDQTLWIENATGQITKTVVRHTEPGVRGFRTGAYRVDQERRRTDRSPVAGDATIHWGDSHVGPCDTPVVVRNATEFGLQIECAVPLPIGTVLQIVGDQLQCDGSTCYCRESGDKFVIGLHLVRQAYNRNTLEYKGD